ncbi:unnamed protein product [Lepeophtheirus salmonis]|uniref:(salmon louse) hypothetical protein n=1 Tax=Lepeophtheirus salmonis TaxID=72036 RepID=A0A7R8CVV2_LEPSM|nr:unnamed protein product [Lepeophtheirus salmonis]CAF2897462.1 unnamed protein product [Lepeophtheirus salmonis]
MQLEVSKEAQIQNTSHFGIDSHKKELVEERREDEIPRKKRQKINEDTENNILAREKYIIASPPVIKCQFESGIGKSKFLGLDNLNKLGDLIGRDTWLLYGFLDIDSSFMYSPVKECSNNDIYLEGKGRIKAINSVNDCVERVVKVSTGFIGSEKTEKNYQILQVVVEKNKKIRPNQRKQTTPKT